MGDGIDVENFTILPLGVFLTLISRYEVEQFILLYSR